MLDKIKKELLNHSNKEKADIYARFFKTRKGEYGEGDKFIGVNVPNQRKIARKYSKIISLSDTKKLLLSSIHEHRLTTCLIMVDKFQKGDDSEKKEIVEFYLANTEKINNWDLVDLSADKILGAYLIDKDKKILYKLSRSKNLWEKRIAIISTYNFIKNKQFKDTLKISEILLHDKHDLIHKAVGWMLRETGNRNQKIEEKFLTKYYKEMPRTMLRYAIEKFDEDKRRYYMNK
ncbi:MAG: DNA alkylation repair protein [Nanoarchaeota archaeon]|nr:DNA alkylation repair protein [Nanoarchaeota archaeon]